ALADANDAVAVGSGASVTHTASTAIGANATSTTVNQVTLGGAGSSVRVGDIAASTDAQVGPVDVVTVDAAGTLGVQQAASAASVDNVRVSLNALSEVSEAQFTGLSNSVLALDGRVSGLEFQLQDVEERLTGGIAAAMALGGQMIVPDSTVSFSLNASTFQGEQGFAGSVSARLAEKVYISAGVAGSTASDSTGGRVGVAFGF
ncbi:MAG: YadA-like family protein, partial [Erythrobacter sp.]